MKQILEEIDVRVPRGSSVSTDIGEMLIKSYGNYNVSFYPAAVKRADYVIVLDEKNMFLVQSDQDLEEIWEKYYSQDSIKVVLFKRVRDTK